MVKNNKIAVIAGLGGCFDALSQLRKELEIKDVSKVISLGNSVGLHYSIDNFIEQIKDFILLPGCYEKVFIGEYPVPEGGAMGRTILLAENKKNISDGSKHFLRSFKNNLTINNIFFSGCEHKKDSNKINFCFPISYSHLPFLNDLEAPPLPLNEKLALKEFCGKTIFPGLIYWSFGMGVSYYAIIDDNDIVFHKFTYKWNYDLNQITRMFGVIDPNEIEKYWNKYLQESEQK